MRVSLWANPFFLLYKIKEGDIMKFDKASDYLVISSGQRKLEQLQANNYLHNIKGNYEEIGGDSYLSGFVKGFEVVPYPYLVNVNNLPEQIGNTYQGKTLFTLKDNSYKANYKESMQILEYLFPKNKIIFLMCGAGGYAGDTKKMLIALGWDKDKIYNIGGYWYYNGDNNVKVKNESFSEPTYDFWKVNYHDIDFTSLHKA